jgi:hypothetical protein
MKRIVARSNVAADAAVADEAAGRVEHRLAAQRAPALDPVLVAPRDLEVAERQARVHRRAVRGPAGGVRPGRRQIPARLADLARVDHRVTLRGVLRPDDAVLGVGFPVEVARELDQAAEARLGLSHQVEGARLDRREPHQPLQHRGAEAVLGEIVERAGVHRAGADGGIGIGGEDDDRLLARPGQRAEGIEPAAVGQIQVGDHEAERLGRHLRQRLAQGAGHLEARLHPRHAPQLRAHQLGKGGVVLDEEDADGPLQVPLAQVAIGVHCACLGVHGGAVPAGPGLRRCGR